MSRPFKHPSVTPKKRGLYQRDWRGTSIEPEHERELTLDLWEPISDPRDILYPGVWYVYPGINDAIEQRLPWREPTPTDRAAWYRRHPEARDWNRK